MAAWLAAVDEATGATYYYNPATQQTSWTPPALDAAAGQPLEGIGALAADALPSPRGLQAAKPAGSYSVVRVDSRGYSVPLELRRRRLLDETGLPARDLRRIDPALTLTTSAPTLLVGDRVLLLNVGSLRLVVSRECAYLFDPGCSTARYFLATLVAHLRTAPTDEEAGFSSAVFELRVVEAALVEATGQLDALLLDASARTSKLMRGAAANRAAVTEDMLEELRLVKQSLVELDSRASAIRAMLLEVLDDPEDIRGMRLEYGVAATRGAAAPPSAKQLENAADEVENLLEYYLQRCEAAHGEAERLLENTRDLEESVSVSLSARRYEVNKLELYLSVATFAISCGALITGVFGMNLRNTARKCGAAQPGCFRSRRPSQYEDSVVAFYGMTCFILAFVAFVVRYIVLKIGAMM